MLLFVNFLNNVFFNVVFFFIILFVDFILGFKVILIFFNLLKLNIGVFIKIFLVYGWIFFW